MTVRGSKWRIKASSSIRLQHLWPRMLTLPPLLKRDTLSILSRPSLCPSRRGNPAFVHAPFPDGCSFHAYVGCCRPLQVRRRGSSGSYRVYASVALALRSCTTSRGSQVPDAPARPGIAQPAAAARPQLVGHSHRVLGRQRRRGVHDAAPPPSMRQNASAAPVGPPDSAVP